MEVCDRGELNNRFRKAGLCARKWPDCIFFHLLIQSFWVPCDLSSKNFSKKNLLFEAEIYVLGYAQNAGFCIEVGKTGQPNNFLDNLNFDDYQIFLGVSNTDTVIVFIFLYFF